MHYTKIDMDDYYRKDVFRHFSEDCRCSVSITNKVDVTELYNFSKKTGTKFYINFLYILAKVLNSRDDYKLAWHEGELIVYEKIHPTQYIFHDDTETFTIAYTEYNEKYDVFYNNALNDLLNAKETREYGLDLKNHPNWFDASYIPWISYESLHIELPDGHLYFNPIINWGKFKESESRLWMPVTVRLNHAAADGYLVALVYKLMEKEINLLCK